MLETEVWVDFGASAMDLSIGFFGVLNVFHDDVAVLKGRLSESDFQKLDVFDFLIDVIIFGTH